MKSFICRYIIFLSFLLTPSHRLMASLIECDHAAGGTLIAHKLWPTTFDKIFFLGSRYTFEGFEYRPLDASNRAIAEITAEIIRDYTGETQTQIVQWIQHAFLNSAARTDGVDLELDIFLTPDSREETPGLPVHLRLRPSLGVADFEVHGSFLGTSERIVFRVDDPSFRELSNTILKNPLAQDRQRSLVVYRRITLNDLLKRVSGRSLRATQEETASDGQLTLIGAASVRNLEGVSTPYGLVMASLKRKGLLVSSIDLSSPRATAGSAVLLNGLYSTGTGRHVDDHATLHFVQSSRGNSVVTRESPGSVAAWIPMSKREEDSSPQGFVYFSDIVDMTRNQFVETSREINGGVFLGSVGENSDLLLALRGNRSFGWPFYTAFFKKYRLNAAGIIQESQDKRIAWWDHSSGHPIRSDQLSVLSFMQRAASKVVLAGDTHGVLVRSFDDSDQKIHGNYLSWRALMAMSDSSKKDDWLHNEARAPIYGSVLALSPDGQQMIFSMTMNRSIFVQNSLFLAQLDLNHETIAAVRCLNERTYGNDQAGFTSQPGTFWTAQRGNQDANQIVQRFHYDPEKALEGSLHFSITKKIIYDSSQRFLFDHDGTPDVLQGQIWRDPLGRLVHQGYHDLIIHPRLR